MKVFKISKTFFLFRKILRENGFQNGELCMENLKMIKSEITDGKKVVAMTEGIIYK